MARDRIADWGTRKPKNPLKEIGQALHRYLGDAAEIIELVHGTRWIATLHGHESRAFPSRGQIVFNPGPRWFEVYCGADHIDVMTRQADEYTNAVANGFFEVYARYWDMERDEAK